MTFVRTCSVKITYFLELDIVSISDNLRLGQPSFISSMTIGGHNLVINNKGLTITPV